MTELPSHIKLSLQSLRNEARTVQRGGLVLPSRKILEQSNLLREELEKLIQERDKLSEQVTAQRATEIKLKDEIKDLQNEVRELSAGWPVPKETIEPLPEDYWETAQ